MAVYEIWTSHQTALCVQDATGIVCHRAPGGSETSMLLACLPISRPHVCLLLPAVPISLTLTLEHDHEPGHVISLRVIRLQDGKVRLIHPLSRRYLCAEESKESTGRVLINRDTASLWETFELREVGSVAREILVTLLRLQSLLDVATDAPATLELMMYPKSGLAFTSGDFAALTRLLQHGELEWLGRAVGRSWMAASRLAEMMLGDFWAGEVIPALFGIGPLGPAQGAARQVDALPPYICELDVTARDHSLGQVLTIAARRDRAPTRGICIVATARNEGLYLLEWLAHHRLLGVETFFVYSNDNLDGSERLLAALADAGVIVWIDNRTSSDINPQYKAYGHAFQVLPDILKYRWAAVLDLDEFIMIDRNLYTDLPAFLHGLELQRTDAVALCWVLYGSGGEVRRTSAPVSQRFTRREPGANSHVKSISRPGVFRHSHCHYPIADAAVGWTFRTAQGDPHTQRPAGDPAFAAAPSQRGAWVNHYIAKSAEEYLLRRTSSKGDVTVALQPEARHFSSTAARWFLDQHGSDTMVTDATMPLPGLEAEIARLSSLPGVAEAMASVEASYATRLAAVADMLDTADDRFRTPGLAENWFAETFRAGLGRA